MPNPPPKAATGTETSSQAQIKRALRARLKAERSAMPPTRRASLDALICAQLLDTLLETDRPNRAIAMYVAHNGEPDVWPVAQRLLESNRVVYLPVLSGQALRFHRFDPDAPMTPNRFGIPEPVDQASVAVAALDWVVMPLLGFGVSGARLGMGGGFYDRTLAELSAPGPVKAGVAYSSQQVDALPVEPWDVSMDVVVTDRGRLWVE